LITDIAGLPAELRNSAAPEELAYLESLRQKGLLPFGVTPHFASLAGPGYDDPIRRQFFPDPQENLADPFALEDPLGEKLYQVTPRLIHQYQDRVLLLAGEKCAGYCRYCFRRIWIARKQSSQEKTFINEEALPPILEYLKTHTEIQEVLVSGGDPLTASDEQLAWLFRELRGVRQKLLLRLCTRAPITNPARLTSRLIELLASVRPLRMAIHLNHPKELAEPARKALGACLSAGLPILVQTVLLRGINDKAELLARLFQECAEAGLSPYYLFQLDLAPGTAHFRVPLKQGLDIYRELGRRVSNKTLPVYAVDLPGGGGKLRLQDGVIAGFQQDPRGQVYALNLPNGKFWTYPVH
jgi:lysine 2,3-aminomutase